MSERRKWSDSIFMPIGATILLGGGLAGVLISGDHHDKSAKQSSVSSSTSAFASTTPSPTYQRDQTPKPKPQITITEHPSTQTTTSIPKLTADYSGPGNFSTIKYGRSATTYNFSNVIFSSSDTKITLSCYGGKIEVSEPRQIYVDGGTTYITPRLDEQLSTGSDVCHDDRITRSDHLETRKDIIFKLYSDF